MIPLEIKTIWIFKRILHCVFLSVLSCSSWRCSRDNLLLIQLNVNFSLNIFNILQEAKLVDCMCAWLCSVHDMETLHPVLDKITGSVANVVYRQEWLVVEVAFLLRCLASSTVLPRYTLLISLLGEISASLLWYQTSLGTKLHWFFRVTLIRRFPQFTKLLLLLRYSMAQMDIGQSSFSDINHFKIRLGIRSQFDESFLSVWSGEFTDLGVYILMFWLRLFSDFVLNLSPGQYVAPIHEILRGFFNSHGLRCRCHSIVWFCRST